MVFNSELGEGIQEGVDSLRDKGINKIIALGHSGIEVDIEVANNVRGVDVVIGGHTNTFLYTGKALTLMSQMAEMRRVFTWCIHFVDTFINEFSKNTRSHLKKRGNTQVQFSAFIQYSTH